MQINFSQFLMGLGVVGILIFCPWMIYLDKKKLPLTRQRIGCLISMVLIICAFALIPTVLSPEQATPSVPDAQTDAVEQSATSATASLDAIVDALQEGLSEKMKEINSEGGDCAISQDENLVTVTLWNKDWARLAALALEGNASALEQWNQFVDSMVGVETSCWTTFEKYGHGEVVISLSIPNYEGQELLFIYGGKVLYDHVNNALADESNEPEAQPEPATTEPEGDTQDTEPPINEEPEEIPAPAVEQPEPEPKPVTVKANAQLIKLALLDEIPQVYQRDSMFFTDVYVNTDNTVEVSIQLDQRNGDKDAALSLAVTYYKAAKRITEDAGGQMGRYDISILNNAALVGLYHRRRINVFRHVGRKSNQY